MTKVLYHIIKNFDDYSEDALYNHISQSSLTKILKYKFKEDRIRSFIGRKLLDFAFGKNVGDLLLYSEYGKPFLRDEKYFSISHSGHVVLLAISESAVGIDIEEIKEIDTDSFLPYLSSNEQKELEISVSHIIEFYNIWTQKEAILKAESTGLTDNMSHLDSFTHSKYQVLKLPINANYCCHLAHLEKDYNVESVHISTFLNPYSQILP